MEEDTRSLAEVVVQTVILSQATILSLAGNSFIFLAIYRNRRLRIITIFYVLSLAVADIMMATFSFPFQVIASGLRKWPFDYKLCQFSGFVVQYWVHVSVCILALASINRYFCVVKPHKYLMFFTKKKTVRSILAVWIFSAVQTLIYIFATPIIYRWIPENLYCRATFPDERSERISYLFFASFYIVPLSLVVFCYGSIHRVVKRHKIAVAPTLREANGRGIIISQEIKSSRILFAAVVGFFICWMPFIVLAILEFGFQVSIPSSAQSIYPLFCSTSAWINPIIYGVMNRAIRKEFRNVLFCKKD
ncbi:melatonin receptor type 1A-like [Oculina patagonica]